MNLPRLGYISNAVSNHRYALCLALIQGCPCPLPSRVLLRRIFLRWSEARTVGIDDRLAAAAAMALHWRHVASGAMSEWLEACTLAVALRKLQVRFLTEIFGNSWRVLGNFFAYVCAFLAQCAVSLKDL